MADETIVLKVQVDNNDTIKKLEQNKLAINNLKEEQSKLTKAYKDGVVTAKEYASESVRLEQLTKSHAKEYSKLSNELQNTKSFTEKLTEALSKQGGPLGAVAGGIGEMTKAAKAFIVSPFGAAVTAIGLALGLVISYLKGSAEGQDKLNKVTAIGAALLGKLTDAIQWVGKVLFDNFIKAFEAAAGILDKFASFLGINTQGIKDYFNELASDDGLAGMKNRNDELERELILLKSNNEAKIADLKLKAEDKSLDVKARVAALQEAKKLQDELSAKQLEFAENRLKIAQMEHGLSNSTKEDKREEAELEAEIGRIKKENADRSKEIFTKEQELKDTAVQKEIERLAILTQAEIDAEIKKIKAKADAYKEVADNVDRVIKQQDEQLKQDEKLIDDSYKLSIAIGEENKETVKLDKTQQKEIQTSKNLIASLKDRMNVIQGFGSMLQIVGAKSKELAIAGVVIEKASAISQIISNTMAANAKAVAASPITFGQPWVGINTAAAAFNIATTIASATEALSNLSGFMSGGHTGSGANDEVRGVVHANEYVVPAPIVAANPGIIAGLESARTGMVATNQATEAINQTSSISNALKGITVVSSWVEALGVGRDYSHKMQIVER